MHYWVITCCYLTCKLFLFWSTCCGRNQHYFLVSSFSPIKNNNIKNKHNNNNYLQQQQKSTYFRRYVHDDDDDMTTSDLDKDLPVADVSTQKFSFTIETKNNNNMKRKWWKRQKQANQSIQFDYDVDILHLKHNTTTTTLSSPSKSETTRGIVFIHPIGVGIGKWFYQRLLKQLQQQYDYTTKNENYVLIVPDLLGSASASNPINVATGTPISKLGLLNISDWSKQILYTMSKVNNNNNNNNDNNYNIQDWCLVANGGCSPIALQVAQRCIEQQQQQQHGFNSTLTIIPNVTNIILSSTPRLPFFLSPLYNPEKVQKAYKRLCGIIGNIFWWYACRNQGVFIQKFSAKNLAANVTNLGPNWQYNCYTTACINNGKSRYSTFAFLAGTLQDGCVSSLDTILSSNNNNITINFIKGADVRQNQAKSWFWQKRKKNKNNKTNNNNNIKRETLRDYVEKYGKGGKEIIINGRIALAHEDPVGYASTIMKLITE